tara:strand:- start:87 stop:1319 length:1233 start_codon:yes stop_codon:yes gene_type:complete
MGIFEHIAVNDYVSEESYSERVYLQFWVGHVDIAVSHHDHPAYNGPKDINSVIVQEYKKNDMSQGKFGKRFYPLLRGIVDCPMPGDQVLLCQFGGENYYMGPINTLNKPNYNVDQLHKLASSSDSSTLSDWKQTKNIKETHKLSNLGRLEKVYIKNLDDPDDEYEGLNPNMSSEEYAKTHQIGDFYIEGRYGNSIRVGGRKSNPNIIISNGRLKDATDIKPAALVQETLSDCTVLAMLRKGKINDYFLRQEKVYNPSCNLKDLTKPDTLDNPRKIDYDAEYEDPQTLLVSKKIIFDNRSISPFIISSFSDLNIGTSSIINMKARGDINLDALKVHLGTEETATEPLVLGNELKSWLNSLCIELQAMFMSTCSPGGPSSVAANSAKFGELAGKLDDILTDYAFVQPEKPSE